ncbi:hypothetical protein BJV82DRAFT_603351 [Fennellomyces sp. T-0311]|nr:hypothetical protein BJV82DRAFT_603351 [Fennellomyces sp. T-0311]
MLPLTKENLEKLNNLLADPSFNHNQHIENTKARSLSSLSLSDGDDCCYYYDVLYDERRPRHQPQQQQRASTWSAGTAKKFLARKGSRLIAHNKDEHGGFWTKVFRKSKRSKQQEIPRLSEATPVWYSQFTLNPPPPSPDLVSTYSTSPRS